MSAAVGEGRRCAVTENIRRAPQTVKTLPYINLSRGSLLFEPGKGLLGFRGDLSALVFEHGKGHFQAQL